MEPARSALAEDLFPIDLAGFKLGNRCVPAVGTSLSSAYPETALREIQPISYFASDAIVFHPSHHRLVHAALVEQILKETPDCIVSNRRDNGSLEPKTPF